MIESTPHTEHRIQNTEYRLRRSALGAHHSALTNQHSSLIARPLTYETALWVGIGAVAVLARVWALGHAPLNDAEAALALQALALAGHASPLATASAPATTANPLFSAMQAICMSIFGATDATARWLPALAGVVLCLLPAALRREMGTARALAFSALLALSPTLWFIARQSDGAQLAWTLAFGVWCVWATNARAETEPVEVGWLLAGLLLACGADAVTPALTVGAVLAAGNPLSRLRVNARAGLMAAGACVIGATGFGLRLPGLGDMFNGYALWFSELTGGPLTHASAGLWPLPALRGMAGLLLYEPLIWISALAGLAVLILNGSARPHPSTDPSADKSYKTDALHGITPWVAWAGAGFGLWLLTQSRTVDGLAPALIGGAALASAAVERALHELADRRQWIATGAVAGISAIMLVYGFMGVLLYAGRGETTWLLTALLAALMVGGIAIVATLTLNLQATLAGVGIAAGICLTLYTLSAGVQLTQTRPDNPAEPYNIRATLPGVRDLREALGDASARAYGEPLAISIELPESAPASLKWAVRDWRRATLTPQPGTAEALLTPAGASIETDYTYIGSAFRIAAATSIRAAGCDDRSGQFNCFPLARWLVLRTLDGSATPAQNVTRWALWLRQDVARRYSGR